MELKKIDTKITDVQMYLTTFFGAREEGRGCSGSDTFC
jgi:hypothetical protein